MDDARTRFREWVRQQEGGIPAVAQRFGCTAQSIYKALTERPYHRPPGKKLAKKIEAACGIPAAAWRDARRRAPRWGRPRAVRTSTKRRYILVLEDGRSLFGEFTEVNHKTESGQRVLIGRLLASPGSAPQQGDAAA
jgi:hypothetical protein